MTSNNGFSVSYATKWKESNVIQMFIFENKEQYDNWFVHVKDIKDQAACIGTGTVKRHFEQWRKWLVFGRIGMCLLIFVNLLMKPVRTHLVGTQLNLVWTTTNCNRNSVF